MEPSQSCPVCRQTDQVAKVSVLYLMGLGLQHASQPARDGKSVGAITLPQVFTEMDAAEMKALSRRLKPPSSGKAVLVRPVNPDLAVLVFSLVVPLFLYQIYITQPGMLAPMLGILAVFYGFYVWKRKSLLAKFQQDIEKRRVQAGRVKRGIERWLRLYYCARDDCIFEPGSTRAFPADQISACLLQDQGLGLEPSR